MKQTTRLLIALFAALPMAVAAQAPAPADKPAEPKPAPKLAPTSVTPTPAARSGPAAEVVLVTGVVTAGGRSLSAGDKVNEGDTVLTGRNSYANLKFSDGGRVLLRPSTEFTVEKFAYAAPAAAPTAPAPAEGKPAAAAGSSAFFRLVRGGFRAISGLIGSADRQAYRVTTPTATIGIRGTDYEATLCSDDCPQVESKAGMDPVQVAASDLSGLELAQAGGGGAGGSGIVVATNEGSVLLKTSQGEFPVDAGQVAIAMSNGQVFPLPTVPDLLLNDPLPNPEDCE